MVEVGAAEILPSEKRQSAITSHALGIPELSSLFEAVPMDAELTDYQSAAMAGNVLALATESGRDWRFATLRRLYLLRRDSLLFRSLRDLWDVDPEGRPLLAGLCALATDTVFRASAGAVLEAQVGSQVAVDDFARAIEETFPGAYAPSTLRKAASNAYASWQQTGHLAPAKGGSKLRQSPSCRANDLAFALFLGHLQGAHGDALFGTLWARVLDEPPSQLHELAIRASQQGLIEYRSAGGITEVGFRHLLRPM